MVLSLLTLFVVKLIEAVLIVENQLSV